MPMRERKGGKEVAEGQIWISVRIPLDVHSDLKGRAKDIDRSVSWLMRQYAIQATGRKPEGPTELPSTNA